MVRRHALLLLSRLLLQDFLKWRGLLLFRFLACLADNDTQVAQVRLICMHRQPYMYLFTCHVHGITHFREVERSAVEPRPACTVHAQ